MLSPIAFYQSHYSERYLAASSVGCSKMKCVLVFALCIFSAHGAQYRVDPLVLTDQGLIRGMKASDGSYSSFLGVPYATVDSNDPFGPALPHDGFGSGVFNAYDGLSKCPQSIPLSSRASTRESESLDCLKMNIYSPILASTQNPLPVLVWIHGGDFAVGSAGEYNPDKLARQGILVVTVNYRLGPYGFMCLNIPSVPGNQGLKDQYEALVWIRNNIRAFGGNPYNVTIAGQNAGSTSALLHLYSDKDKLYNKVIVESGTPQNVEMFVNGDEEAALKLASHLGFSTSDTLEALDFLKETSYELVAGAAADLNMQFKPCREKSFSGIDNFIEYEPPALSNPRKVRNTPVLIGHTSNEFANKIRDDSYYKTNPFYKKIEDNFNLDEDKLSQAADIVRHFYIGDEDITEATRARLEQFESDVNVNHPIQRTITKLLNEQAQPLYEYEFSFKGEEDGVANGEEIKYLFSSAEESDENNLIATRLIKMWSNFVKYGNPTPQAEEVLPVTWNPVSSESRPYLKIDSTMEMKSRINNDRMAFWDLFYTLYEKDNKFSRECIKH